MDLYLWLSVLGALSGFLSGMLGIGGGVIIVPGMLWILQAFHVIPDEYLMHVVTSTSLAAMIAPSASSVWSHHKERLIDWVAVKHMSLFSIVGILVGVFIAMLCPMRFIGDIFAIYLIVLALRLIVTGKNKESTIPKKPSHLRLLGLSAGALSGLLGVGGGVVVMPFLIRLGMDTHRAIATTAASTLVISFFGTLTCMVTGSKIEAMPADSTGFVYWPAAGLIALFGILFAPLGAKLSQKINSILLRQIFGGMLILIAIEMVFTVVKI